MFLSTAADNHRARALYESLGGGLAEHGPTVNYWFRLDGAGISGTRADDRAIAEYFLLGAETAATLLGRPELAERWDQLSALDGFTVGQLAGHFVRAVGVTNVALARGEAEEDPIASLPEWYAGRIDSWSDRADEIRSNASGEATLGAAGLPARYQAAVSECWDLLGSAPPNSVRVQGGDVLSLGDYLLVRAVELVTHADDLAASLGQQPPAFPGRLVGAVTALLVDVARVRHGEMGVLRALARRERDAVQALRVI